MTVQPGRVSIQIIALLILAIFPSVFSAQPQQRGWAGILPLQSTRAEVEAQLGKSSDACQCRYRNPNETVVLDYAKGPCKGPPHGWNVAAGTVLQITVHPTSQLSLAQLGVNEKEYARNVSPGEPVVHFTNLRAGIKYSVSDGTVTSISYIPSLKDVSLRCGGFPKYDGGVREYQPYAAFSAKAQMIEERLGEFAAQLADNDRLKGFIITYAGKVARRGEAKLMAEKARRDLALKLGLPASRITVVDGGFRETAEYELFLVSPEMPSPAPTPTLASSQVRILGRRFPRPRRRIND